MNAAKILTVVIVMLATVSACAIITSGDESDADSGLRLMAGEDVDIPKYVELNIIQTKVQCFDFPGVNVYITEEGNRRWIGLTGTPTILGTYTAATYGTSFGVTERFMVEVIPRAIDEIIFDSPEVLDVGSTTVITATPTPAEYVGTTMTEWSIESGATSGEIVSTTDSGRGGSVVILGNSPGTLVLKVTISNDTMSREAAVSIDVRGSVTVIDPIQYTSYLGTVWTYIPETDPPGAEITLDSVKRDGSEQLSHGLEVSESGTGYMISGEFPSEGLWEVTFTASYNTYAPTTKTVMVLVTEAPTITEMPTLHSISASQSPEYERAWFFVAIGAGNYTSITWDFGEETSEPNSSTSVVHRFQSAGLYDVSCTVSNSLGQQVTKTVTVLVTDSGSKNDAWVNVLYSTMFTIPSEDTEWDLEGPTWLSVQIRTIQGVTYAIVSGTPTDPSTAGESFEVTFSAGGSSETWTINVHEATTAKPTASFILDPDPPIGLTVNLVVTGEAVSRLWIDWGDGNGEVRQPTTSGGTHTYEFPGNYMVTIRVDNNHGSSTAQRSVVVSSGPSDTVYIADIGNMTVYVGDSVSVFCDVNPPDATITFTGADWLTVDAGRLIGAPKEPGSYTVTITVSKDGVSDTTSFTILVKESAQSSIEDIEDAEIVVGESFSIVVITDPVDASITVSGADWLSIDGHRIFGTPDESGTYDVVVSAIVDGSTVQTGEFTITVTDKPVVDDEEHDWLIIGIATVITGMVVVAGAYLRNWIVLVIGAAYAAVVVILYYTGVI